MTESEWLDHAVPGLMLRFLSDGASERKLRLFTCNCAEWVWRSMLQRNGPAPFELAWAAADGLLGQSELAAAIPESPPPVSGPEIAEWYAGQMLETPFHPHSPGAITRSRYAVESIAVRLATVSGQDTARASREARTALASFLRDLFGNPFRPVTFSSDWRTDTALALARQMYECRDFSPMPILADALQDAGCDSADILDHCRGPDVHVRGCFVVDLVLGKG